jgi:hypothetical protein
MRIGAPEGRNGRQRAHHVADGAEPDHQDAFRRRRRRQRVQGREDDSPRAQGTGRIG